MVEVGGERQLEERRAAALGVATERLESRQRHDGRRPGAAEGEGRGVQNLARPGAEDDRLDAHRVLGGERGDELVVGAIRVAAGVGRAGGQRDERGARRGRRAVRVLVGGEARTPASTSCGGGGADGAGATTSWAAASGAQAA